MTGIPAGRIVRRQAEYRRALLLPDLGHLLGAMLATQNLLDSREGRAIRALKGGGLMAEAMGVNTARYRRSSSS
jgi:branched-chain amino acid transport system permease protein